MMKETNIQPQVTSTIAGDDGEAVGATTSSRTFLPTTSIARCIRATILAQMSTQRLTIDLDDGVRVNYPKYYPLVEPIKGLDKTEK